VKIRHEFDTTSMSKLPKIHDQLKCC